jgi:phosphonate transport system substrate-binding protein
MRLLKTLAVIAAVTTFSFAATAKDIYVNKTSDGKVQINLGILATESQENLMKRWGPIIDLMKEKTGYVVKPYFASDYAGVIEGMRFNKVDVVLYGNKSAMEAVKRAGAEIFAQVIEPGGGLGYYSVLHTLKTNTKINSLADVLKCDKTISFGIGDPNSTSGFLVPTTFIFAKHGVDPQKCFKTVRNASHETNLLSVANGQVDVATANNKAMHIRLKRNHPKAYAKLKEIWRSPLIPSDPLAYRENLPEDVKAQIFHFFVGLGRYGTPEQVRKERAILKYATFAGFKPSSNAQLFPIREMALNKDIMNIKADSKLSDAEKQQKTSALARQIKEIQALESEIPNDMGKTHLMN